MDAETNHTKFACISSFVVSEINANYVWFVSASIDYNMLGIYTKKIDRDLIPYITCKCDDSFIDRIFNLFEKNIYKSNNFII